MVVNEAGPVSRRWVGGCKALAGVLGLALAVLASPAGAVTYTVTTASDTVAANGACSLREAILAANNTPANGDCGGGSNGNDTIVFSFTGPTTITLGSSLPPIVSGQGTLTIDGGGNVTISGNNSVRVMVVNSGADLTLRNLTIERGNASPGGGALNDGTLRIENSTFRQNTASLFGGGVRNNGTLTITNSIFSENTAGAVGGGAENHGTLTITGSTFAGNSASDFGGGVANGGTLTITGSTFSGNSAGFDGGGVRNRSGTLTIANSTFSGNGAGRDGGGVWSGRLNPFSSPTVAVYNSTFSENQAGGSGGGLRIVEGDATLKNTIMANSTGGGDCVGTLTGSNLNNLIEDTGANACGLTDGVDGNIIGQDPQLDPLFGSPAYFPLRLGSPARDAGDPTTCQDPPVNNRSQNGIPRPQDGDGNGVPVCDIGSFEALGLLADMRALGGMVPAVLAPGGSYSLSFSCENLGLDPASQATCGVSVSAGSVSAVNCMPSVPTSSPLIPRWFISCTFTYTAPGMPGGSDTPQTGAVFTFTAGSVTSDPNTNNNTLTSATVPLVDALDDAVSLPGGIIGATFDVGANDQLGASSPPAGASYSLLAETTCSGASIGATSGVATFNVPALATCVVVYQVCVSEACDTAQLVVTGLLPPPRSIPMLGPFGLLVLLAGLLGLGRWGMRRGLASI